MAGVFGNPVTNETLEELPQYKRKKIEAVDRAHVALLWKNAEKKDLEALKYAEKLKETCDVDIVTLCLVYNATGATVEYADHRDWEGRRGTAPYPIMIDNGQWGAFLHQKYRGSDYGSVGAVVYRGTNARNKDCDWLVSWNNRKSNGDNIAYTEIGLANHFNGKWDQVKANLENSHPVGKSDSNGCLSFVTMGDEYCSVCWSVLTLENANNNE